MHFFRQHTDVFGQKKFDLLFFHCISESQKQKMLIYFTLVKALEKKKIASWQRKSPTKMRETVQKDWQKKSVFIQKSSL